MEHTKEQLEQLQSDIERILQPVCDEYGVKHNAGSMDGDWGIDYQFEGYVLIGKQRIFNLMVLTTTYELTMFDIFTNVDGFIIIQMYK